MHFLCYCMILISLGFYIIMLKTAVFLRWCWIFAMIIITLFSLIYLSWDSAITRDLKLFYVLCILSDSGQQLEYLCFTYAIFLKPEGLLSYNYARKMCSSTYIPSLYYICNGKWLETDIHCPSADNYLIKLILHFKMLKKL